ncbi:MAG: hypothetical protein IPM82_05565 [Saprospiraceae bacterium]|nr:hypothetical protein [Saprospiraceae bacterium]
MEWWKFTPSSPSAVEDVVAANGLSLFPNPTTGDFEVQWSSLELGEYEIAVLNSMGQVVRRSVHQNRGIGSVFRQPRRIAERRLFRAIESVMELRWGRW